MKQRKTLLKKGVLTEMDEKELKKLIEKYQKRADDAEQAYQETGVQRYSTAQWTNQKIADALRIALAAKEDHETLQDMKLELSNFASRGAAAISPHRSESERAELAAILAKEIADYGKQNGLI